MIVNKSKYGCVFCQEAFKRWEDLIKHTEKKHKTKKWMKVIYDGGYRMATTAGEVGGMSVEIECQLLKEGLRSH
jgi:hypothetical protein